MNHLQLPENFLPISVLEPKADAAGRTGAWVSLKSAVRAWVEFYVDQGNAATIAVSINQASAIAGTGSKVITNAVPIWANQDCDASAFTRATDAVNFTTSAAVKKKLVIFQIDPATLDVAGGFDCITVITGASNAANITSAKIWLETSYGQATPINAKAD